MGGEGRHAHSPRAGPSLDLLSHRWGGSKREDEDEKAGGGPENLAALRRQLGRSWRRCTDVAVQLLLPDGYPHSVSSDYLNYSLWRGVQGVASQISGVLSTQVLAFIAILSSR